MTTTQPKHRTTLKDSLHTTKDKLAAQKKLITLAALLDTHVIDVGDIMSKIETKKKEVEV